MRFKPGIAATILTNALFGGALGGAVDVAMGGNFFGAGMAAGSFPPTPGVPTINQANLTTIYASLTALRAENGQYPEHAARMFCGNPLTPADAGSSGPQSATVFGMPRGPIQAGIATAIALENMADAIQLAAKGNSCN